MGGGVGLAVCVRPFDGGGANFYAYASDSPVNFIDPFGLEPCYTVLFVSVCYDPPDTSDVAKSAERAHEAQHRADFRNGNFLKLSCGEYEYRGFQKEVPIWKQRIDELKLARRYSRLADAQQKELNDDEEQYDVIKSHTAGSLQLTYPLCQEENEENDVIRNFPHNMNPHPPANGSPWRLPGMDPNL